MAPTGNTQSYQRARHLVEVAFTVILLVFAFHYLRQQWDQIERESLHINVPILVLAQLGVLIGLGLHPLGSWLIVRELGIGCPRIEVWQAFFLSQIAKYLPGGIWSLPSRAFFYRQRGLPTQRSIEAVFWESSLSVVGATLVAAAGLPLLAHTRYLVLMVGLLGGLSTCFLAGLLLWQSVRVRGFLQRNVFRSRTPLELHLALSKVGLVIAFYAADWIVIGLGFAALIHALQGGLSVGDWLNLVGLFAGAWAVGFLVLFSPGGIGIREGLLILGTASLINSPIPVMAAVLSRIGWIVAEVVSLAVVQVRISQNNSKGEKLR